MPTSSRPVHLTEATLKALFSKPYGTPGPSAQHWRAVCDAKVHFQEPTQEKQGIGAYIDVDRKTVEHHDYVDFVGPTFSRCRLLVASCASCTGGSWVFVVLHRRPAISANRVAHHPVASRYLSGRIRSAAIPVQHYFVMIIHSLMPEPLSDKKPRVVLA